MEYRPPWTSAQLALAAPPRQLFGSCNATPKALTVTPRRVTIKPIERYFTTLGVKQAMLVVILKLLPRMWRSAWKMSIA